jgi:hypothetical protein
MEAVSVATMFISKARATLKEDNWELRAAQLPHPLRKRVHSTSGHFA